MTTAGRPRTEGERYPGGKLKAPAKYSGVSPAVVRRMLDLHEEKACDPRLGSIIGKLRIEQKLTTQQTAAAMSYAELRGRFHRVMGFQPRTAASPSYEQGYGHCGGAEDEARILRVRRDHGSMLAVYSPAEAIVLDRFCVDDVRPASDELRMFTRLLDRLVGHFGLQGH